MGTDLEKLKFNLQERQFPYFDDIELQMLLDNNEGNILKSSYQGCIMKAQSDDGVSIGSIKTQSNRAYWLSLAESFKPKQSYNYISSIKRADGQ